MPNVREMMNKSPWLGWAVAGVFLAAAAVMFFRSQNPSDPYDPRRTTELVTIKFTDTNDEITMPRGRMEKLLRGTGVNLDPSKGITNPKTGQPTGFLYSKSEWESTVKRLNEEAAAFNDGQAPAAAASGIPDAQQRPGEGPVPANIKRVSPPK